ncbi:meprin A subunit beta-like isoform X1 [Seriola aureovittata]|uniref:meprin A subunit beta-like isoform X1 n=1 Tax=Seriola aureovittata TaxID=2871759 RepID=UPI0024BE5CD0|nr:meprin A subunit beta-like isoform X1 [Seriola aureovittata]
MGGRKPTGVLVLHIACLLCGATLCLPTPKISDYDVDGGRDLDIFDINEEAGLNLVEGDIVLDERQTRNSIIGDEYRWPKTIPYYMEDDLEINAKGVILKAFEQYRLKTCIDFKPWNGEANYISIFKGGGCFSSVGNRRVGKQRLSIGRNCDRIATIEHEFLHALGFWHEQSRADRDDYVNIMWDRISDGKEHNFNTYNDTTSSSLGVPYDYGSMMHYSKNAFRNGTEPTIVTKISAFSDVIGQRMEFSDSDLLKLHRLYNCSQASTFLDSCDFERENICGMVQGPGDKADWVRVAKAAGGPDTDYSNMGKCTGSGYFMHFSTGPANTGDTALLESRLLYPKRGYQCLQFFYYNSADPKDTLKIYVREYDKANPNGTLRFIKTIDGSPQDLWQLHHVSLDVKTKFRVVFEGTKQGSGNPAGGMSLDDINLSETTCPEFIWRVKNFRQVMETTPTNTSIFSPPFTSKEGYTFQMQLYPSGRAGYPGELSAYAHLVAREGDTGQKWPCPWKQITMMLMDQHPHIQKRMSNQRSVTTDPNMKATDSSQFFWDDPRKVGFEVTHTDGSKYFRGPGTGTPVYLTHLRAKSRDFIKGGDAIFLLTMEDVSHLTVTQPQPSTTVPPSTSDSTTAPSDACLNVECLNDGVCVVDEGKVMCRCAVGDDWWYYGDKCQYKGSVMDKTNLALASSLSVLGVMLVVTLVSVICVKKKYKKHSDGNSVVMAKIYNTEKM